MRRVHREAHLVGRIGWLRAAVLGANDGIISTASLILGVAAAGATKSNILLAGVSGLVAGAMSMAAGEYVSVSSQSDTEQADLAREKRELLEDPEAETEELTQIYVQRGVERDVARSATADEQGCVGRACSRRAWSVRDHLGEAGAGRPHVSREFLHWSGGASRSRAAVTIKPPDPNCFRGVAGVPCFTWLAWCQDRGRRYL